MITLDSRKKLWGIYALCLGVTLVIYLFWGQNSPLLSFNPDVDCNWYMTVGHGLVAGKIPYRDLFDHKGPVVYFVTAGCCLFTQPHTVLWFIEIVCTSLFFFFSYRLARQWLTTRQSLCLFPLLCVLVATNHCRLLSGGKVESYCLPILTYVLWCVVEYLVGQKQFNGWRSFWLGLCLGIIFWSKFTILMFSVVMLIMWLIVSLRQQEYRRVLKNLIIMIGAVLLVTVPILIYFLAQRAVADLWMVYFYDNLCLYNATIDLGVSLGNYFLLGVFVHLCLIMAVVWLLIVNYQSRHWYLIMAFVVNWLYIFLFNHGLGYYYLQLYPYTVLGMTGMIAWLSRFVHRPRIKIAWCLGLWVITVIFCWLCGTDVWAFARKNKPYPQLAITDIVLTTAQQMKVPPSLFCYKISDYGFYNAAGIIPDEKFFCRNGFSEASFPAMYAAFYQTIREQNHDYVVTDLTTWEEDQEFLSSYYQPYTGDLTTSTFNYVYTGNNFFDIDIHFVLLSRC